MESGTSVTSDVRAQFVKILVDQLMVSNWLVVMNKVLRLSLVAISLDTFSSMSVRSAVSVNQNAKL